MTTAEMRARLEMFQKNLGDSAVGTCHMHCYDMQLLELASAELSRREWEEKDAAILRDASVVVE